MGGRTREDGTQLGEHIIRVVEGYEIEITIYITVRLCIGYMNTL